MDGIRKGGLPPPPGVENEVPPREPREISGCVPLDVVDVSVGVAAAVSAADIFR